MKPGCYLPPGRGLSSFALWLLRAGPPLKRRRDIEPGEPITNSDLTGPTETLAVLLPAFLPAVAAESYSRKLHEPPVIHTLRQVGYQLG